MSRGETASMAILLIFIGGVLLGCAATVPPTEPEPVRFVISQKGSQYAAAFAFCGESECPQRSLKHFPPPRLANEPLKPETFSVHFPVHSDEFNETGRAEIVAIVLSDAFARAESIVLTGRTDLSGSLAVNQELAVRRTQVVREVLVRAGVPESVISINEAAPYERVEHASEDDMQKMKRVDISIMVKPR